MKVDVEGLPDAHGLISGPPCPPWSKIGRKHAWGDRRAEVFLTVLKWIFHLARRRNSVFTFFVLEIVDGMRSRSGNQKESPPDTVLRKLRHGLPSGWYIQILSCNSHCTAQSRKRLYFVGHRGERAITVPRLPALTVAGVIQRGPAIVAPLSRINQGTVRLGRGLAILCMRHVGQR